MDKTIKSMQKLTNKLTKNKKLAMEFLIRAGICDKNGELAEPYKSK